MVRRYALREDQWARIAGLLPGRVGYVGGTMADNRLFVDVVLYRFRAGIAWRALPERFGEGKAVHPRFGRRAASASRGACARACAEGYAPSSRSTAGWPHQDAKPKRK